ncbi:MAG: hypothetical protein LLG01_01975 [Planctomycetaceae bacterium]|nr:hypothetical protein [Planctomycetaceae bacterium]
MTMRTHMRRLWWIAGGLLITALALVFFKSLPGDTSATSAPVLAAGDSCAVLIDGSCVGGLPLGDLAEYSRRIKVPPNALGYVRIRSTLSWDADDKSNMLGTVPCGTLLWAQGPLKNPDFGNAIGYAVAVRDRAGRSCRGYVSYTVVDAGDGQGPGRLSTRAATSASSHVSASNHAPWPATIDQAVERLMKELTPRGRGAIAAIKEEDLIDMHMGLGLWVRNNFGLWAGNDSLLKSTGKTHPDEASQVILHALWTRLRSNAVSQPAN